MPFLALLSLSLREKLGTDREDLADRYLKLAEIGNEQRLGFAEQAFRRCLELGELCSPQNYEREYRALFGLAQTLMRDRVLTESLSVAEKAQSCLLEQNEGQETKELVPVLKLQAQLYDLLDNYIKSTEFEQKAMLLKFKR